MTIKQENNKSNNNKQIKNTISSTDKNQRLQEFRLNSFDCAMTSYSYRCKLLRNGKHIHNE